MECERQNIKGILTDELVVLRHIEEKSLFIAKVEIVLQTVVDSYFSIAPKFL